MIKGRVLNLGITVTHHPRKGRLLHPRVQWQNTASEDIRHNYFTHTGTRLFNCLPWRLRDESGITKETFQKKTTHMAL